ncbi:C45 family autoproteolytic acyltransferase/hydolase [Natrononativus amylolyticus]|uniref:C45 family autoproteolytic acyltransferase/hydolase n=1 Tax=Natrononativus amylolyticus TaxID=2963434 RepID=UPI0020CBB13B|nr:C45 family peptidase [Natrononativus amylolyticus]
MQPTELTGTYREIGRQYGAILERVGFAPEPVPSEKRALVRECEPAVRTHAPGLLEELEGIATAGGWERAAILAVPLALGYESGCSVVAVSGDRTADGRPLFGRNYDFYRSFADFAELFRTVPSGRLASVGCSDHWTGRQDGINEAGLAVGHTYVPHAGLEAGVAFGLAARWVLDTCETVEEGVAFLERIPHARNTNFLLADAAGEIAVVEASPARTRVTGPSNGFAAVTNHFPSDSMVEHEPRGIDRTNSTARLTALEAWFDGTSLATIEDLQRRLGDPSSGVCVCGDDADDPVETLWSWTATLDGPEPHLAGGRPDETAYESVPVATADSRRRHPN